MIASLLRSSKGEIDADWARTSPGTASSPRSNLGIVPQDIAIYERYDGV